MIIIFEGMDNSGKTIAVAKVAKLLGLPTIKSLGKSTEEAQVQWMIDLLHKHDKEGPIITDRFPLISEAIYGPIVRGENVLDSIADEWWNTFNERGIVIVYCRPHRDSILVTMGEREQMEGVVAHKTALLEAYDDYMGEVRYSDNETPLIVYDYWTDPDATGLAKDIISVVRGK